jgi:hypothetical protein
MCCLNPCISPFIQYRAAPRTCWLTIQEQGSGLIVRRDALQKRQGVADPIRRRSGELRRVEKGIYRDDLLEQGGHDA